MYHHCIYLPDDSRSAYRQLRNRLPDDLPFYTCLPSQTDPFIAPTGKHALFVLVPTSTLSQAGTTYNWDATILWAKERVFERLNHHSHTVQSQSLVVEHVWTPHEWSKRFGLYDGSAFGLSHTLTHIGPLRPSNRDPVYRGLYYVGGSTHPGGGTPMVLHSANLVYQLICRYEFAS
jgi:phytoene desaturase